MKSPPQLVLASTSAYRRQLLERLTARFTCAAPGVDEAPLPGEVPHALAARLAHAKASAVAGLYPGAWVIGSDQVAVVADDDGREAVLGKPGTADRCIDQLVRCSGRRVTYLTAVAVLNKGTAASSEFIDETRVNFRALDRAVIARYVAHERPFDCAGGFKSEGLGISLCESIHSTDPSALIGLPLIRLSAALRAVGFDIP